MVDNVPERSPFHTSRRRYQFGLATLLLLAIPVSLLAASLGGMLGRDGARAGIPPDYALLMCIATPLGLVIVAGLLRWGLQAFSSPRRHGEKIDGPTNQANDGNTR